MTEILDLKLEIKNWDEKPYREDGDRAFKRAEVTLGSVDDGPTGSFESLLFYRPDGTSAYVSLMQLSGALGGRTGSFVLQGSGGFDGRTAEGTMKVVEGSGTGQLTGITGSATSSSTHEDYPNMPLRLTYQLE